MAKKPIPQSFVSQEPEAEPTVTVLSVFKEKNNGDVYAPAFGVREYEIPKSVIEKYAVLKSETAPDIGRFIGPTLEKKAREILGI